MNLENLTLKELSSHLVKDGEGKPLQKNPEVSIFPLAFEISTRDCYAVKPKVIVSNLSGNAQILIPLDSSFKIQMQKLSSLVEQRLKQLFPDKTVKSFLRDDDDAIFFNLAKSFKGNPRLWIKKHGSESKEYFGIEGIQEQIEKHEDLWLEMVLKFSFLTVKENTVFLTPSLKSLSFHPM